MLIHIILIDTDIQRFIIGLVMLIRRIKRLNSIRSNGYTQYVSSSETYPKIGSSYEKTQQYIATGGAI